MKRPVIFVFGEALVDIFSDNTSAIGGTAFNAAYHLKQLGRYLGFRTELVTRVGNDVHGKQVQQLLAPSNLVQVHPHLPTGSIFIEISADDTIGKAEERTPIPWEGFDPGALQRQGATDCAAVVFDTLALRAGPLKASLDQFLARVPKAIRLYDLNLRTTARGRLFDRDTVLASIAAATIVKMNVAELVTLVQLFRGREDHRADERQTGFVPDDLVRRSIELVQPLIEDRLLVVTAGARGTSVYQRGLAPIRGVPFWKQLTWDRHSKPAGAGDACTAGLLAGLVSGWSMERSTDLANIMGAFVSSCSSASPVITEEIVGLLEAAACSDIPPTPTCLESLMGSGRT